MKTENSMVVGKHPEPQDFIAHQVHGLEDEQCDVCGRIGCWTLLYRENEWSTVMCECGHEESVPVWAVKGVEI